MGVTIPDFFVFGAAKCGTTTLVRHLGAHPDIHMAYPKEPNWFIVRDRRLPIGGGPVSDAVLMDRVFKWSATDEAGYRARFAGAPAGARLGDGSILSIYFEGVAEAIAAERPDARLVACLRHPVERMWSHHLMNRADGLEPLGFEDALSAEAERVAAGWGFSWHYQRMSRFGEQLGRWLDVFDRSQVLVVFLEDLVADPGSTMARVFDHVGVETDVAVSSDVWERPGRGTRSNALADFLRGDGHGPPLRRAVPAPVSRRLVPRLQRLNTTRAPALDPGLRSRLYGRFVDDVGVLESLIGRRVPW